MATEQQIVQSVEAATNVINPDLISEVKILLTGLNILAPGLEKAAQIAGAKPEHVQNVFSSIEKVTNLL